LGGIAVATSPTQRQRYAAPYLEHAAKYPRSLLGVVGPNAECHQTLADKFVLIRILRTQRLGKGVPQLLENNYELFRLDVLIVCFPRNFPK
jgi:hypothetical protein